VRPCAKAVRPPGFAQVTKNLKKKKRKTRKNPTLLFFFFCFFYSKESDKNAWIASQEALV